MLGKPAIHLVHFCHNYYEATYTARSSFQRVVKLPIMDVLFIHVVALYRVTYI